MIHGIDIDQKGRCAHYASGLDIINIRFPCCKFFYACRECHDALEEHEALVWGAKGGDQPVILCGNCQGVLTARAYLTCQHSCPNCKAPFNPKCQSHYLLYFSKELLDLFLES